MRTRSVLDGKTQGHVCTLSHFFVEINFSEIKKNRGKKTVIKSELGRMNKEMQVVGEV